MIIKPETTQRGVTMLGLMALILVLGVMCALILERSAETYRAGAMLVWRLQARAAAEGVAAIAAADPAHPPAAQVLGAATVTCAAPAAGAPERLTIPIVVDIRPATGDEVRFTAQYRACFVRDASAWRLLRLEE